MANPEVAWSFGDAVRELFPSGPSGRLSRALNVNQRLVQRWIGGSQEPTARVVEWVKAQQDLLRNSAVDVSVKHVQQALDESGVDREVVASRLACLYEAITGRQIE